MKFLNEVIKDCRILIDVANYRNYYRILVLMKKYNLLTSIKLVTNSKLYYDVLITDKNISCKDRRTIILHDIRNDLHFLLELCRAILNSDKLKEIIIGIDPGVETGVLMMTDGIIFFKKVYKSHEDVCQSIRDILWYDKVTKYSIKVGSAESCYGLVAKIIGIIGELMKKRKKLKISIELVDEYEVSKLTSLYSKLLNVKDRNILSAYAICIGRGKKLLST